MKTTITYRLATLADATQLKELALLAYGQFAEVLGTEHWATMKGNISNDEKLTDLINKSTCFVAEDSDTIAGMAHILPHGNATHIFQADWSYIRMVGVHPLYTGNGIAKALTQMCIDHAIQAGEKIIALHTSEFMDAARHIYESIGFKKLKEIDPIFGKRYWVYTLDIKPDYTL